MSALLIMAAHMELMLTMRPFDSASSGAKALVTRQGPYTFTSNTYVRSRSSASFSGAGAPPTPALLTRP